MPAYTHDIGRWLEIALWIIGLACLSAYGWAEVRSVRAQTAAMSDLEKEWRLEATVTPDRSLWSKTRVEHYERNKTQGNNLPPLGVLTIPSVGIHVAVFEGTSDRVLNLGVGRVEGTARVGTEGNLALAGHRDGFFRGLKDLEVGDDISIRHRGGVKHYSVSELQVVNPDAVHVLAPTEQTVLTLVTCYPFYFVGPAPERYIVRAIAH